jgi:hypothetical protein
MPHRFAIGMLLMHVDTSRDRKARAELPEHWRRYSGRAA